MLLQVFYSIQGKQAGVLFHSDRGSQYASGAFRDALKAYGILSSMSRRGNCWDTQSKINSSKPGLQLRPGKPVHDLGLGYAIQGQGHVVGKECYCPAFHDA
ncbi:hypothetical protein Pnap_1931 [Polaromonas naphthalenivorans CJ2]|uniref:Integrase catalytic domain-containing protein n=1 Tax=Polaromonas naphthalenivorans (strain CJ2) TaxID=365044 RepID=A1VNL3_POLNA|nr:hypothetical protein Pnap_1931 [Polaromonas naphthalenivorans CJ2]